jgi:hypothetical protein
MSEIREWAAENGQPVAIKGRLPRQLVIDYLMAHPQAARKYLKAHGVTVGQRGRVSAKAIQETVK